MGNTRGIHFSVQHNHHNELDLTLDFGTDGLMLYYAKQLNYNKAKLFYESTLTEHQYRVKHNLYTSALTDSDFDCHFDINAIQQVIAFIEDNIIPQLNKEELDLLEKRGGKDGFYKIFEKDKEFIGINIYDDEWYYSDPLQL